MKMFASDNNSGVHPKILEAIMECNKDHELSYGGDFYTTKAIKMFQNVFGKEVGVHFVLSGTGANIIGLDSILRPFEGVVCAETAHINVDECGAFERLIGAKIIKIPSKEGKIYPEEIKKTLSARGNEHHNQPKVITISQVSEMGTIYTIDEIKSLADFAHKNDLLLHVDGSRISNAAVALGVTFKEMITDTGVDLLSFGGTKNGMMYGEAIISFNENATNSLKYIRKQGMQLISKMRYLSAQFISYLENEIWKQNAQHSNNMAKLLESEVKDIPQIKIISPVEANIIFAQIPNSWIEELQNKYYFYVSDDNVARWVMSYDTTEEEIFDFTSLMKSINKR